MERPIDHALDSGGADANLDFLPRIDPAIFGARGIVPLGHAAFALLLGVLRRARIVHEFDRSTTHLFGSRTKPLASLGRGTTLIVMSRVSSAQVLNSSPP
ncbi:hypothetical protein OG235_08200 [Streptomyces sp. NBC_00024]